MDFIDAKGDERNREVKNKVISISKFLSSVEEDGILCAEHTGAYGDLLVYLCNQAEVPIALVPGYTIKHSLGLLKGKSAIRINRDLGRVKGSLYGRAFW